jgi:hypothetical protein
MGRLTLMLLLLAAAAVAGDGLAGPAAPRASNDIDRGLCPFPLDVRVTTTPEKDQAETTALHFTFVGPSRITLRNVATGRTVVLESSGSHSVDTRTGSITFRGHQVWYWSTGREIPFLSTDGTGSLRAPSFVLSRGNSHARVIDPCALVSPSRPSTRPRTTRAPWKLPAYALSRIGYAGLTPLLGTVIRHDHVHLDLIVNGRKLTIPGGVGMAEPVDRGPCPAAPVQSGDCATHHSFFGQVTNSPLHTHSESGLIHIESDRQHTYTLGEFFDEWGVRFDSDCLGGYCSGGGSELRVFVNGRRQSGDPRGIVLTNHQEIAVIFGSRGTFRSVPSTYKGGWPGRGCGGAGERSCQP